MRRWPSWLLCGMFFVSACSAAQPTASTADTRPLRARPSQRAMTRALERIGDDVFRCLAREASAVTVHGEFEGNSGQFSVSRIDGVAGANLPYAVQTCVRVAAERAHVRAFNDESVAFNHTFNSSPSPSSSQVVDNPYANNNNNPRTTPGPIVPPPSAALLATAAQPVPVEPGESSVSVASGRGTQPLFGGRSVVLDTNNNPATRVRQEMSAFQGCFEQACERDHRVGGTVNLHFSLDAQGRVARIASRLNSDHPDETLLELVARCIESHVRLMHFGPQERPGQEYVVPMVFHPDEPHPRGIPVE